MTLADNIPVLALLRSAGLSGQVTEGHVIGGSIELGTTVLQESESAQDERTGRVTTS